MLEFLLVALAILVGLGVNEIFRRYPKICLVFCSIAPVLLLPFWRSGDPSIGLLFWLKLWLLVVGTWMILFTRLTSGTIRRRFAYLFLYGCLIANVAEALLWTVIDSIAIPNILIGLAGIFLIVTIPTARFIGVDSKGYHDLIWDIPYFWIFSYTLWAWTFGYLAVPNGLFNNAVVLLAPLIVGLVNRKIYIQARACILLFYFMFGFTFPNLVKMTENSNYFDPFVGLLLSSVVVVCSGFHVIQKFFLTKD